MDKSHLQIKRYFYNIDVVWQGLNILKDLKINQGRDYSENAK